MKKIYFGLLISLFLIIPISVSAESSIAVNCDDSEINAEEILNCTLSSTVDSGTLYNKIEGNISVSGVDTITFNGIDGFTGTITDDKLIINNSAKVESSTIGSLQIKFKNTTTGSNKINLSNIKLYNDSNEVASVNDLETSIKVKSTVNTLESLTVADCNGCKLSPSFKKNVTVYAVTANATQIKFNAKASGNATVTGTGTKQLTKGSETFKIVVTSEAGTTKEYKIIVSKVASKSSDTSLKSLTLDKGTLTPNFSNNTTNYSATVDSDKVVIKTVKNDSKATLVGDGEKKLEYGRNEFTIIVTAEDGTTKSYLININRIDTRNANAYLKSLTIDGEKLEFEKDIVEYIYEVDKGTEQVDIKAIPELDSSKVEIEGNNNLKIGDNIVTITVKAEDNSEKIYKIIVKKSDDSQEEIYLDDMKISGYDISFSKEKFDYTLTIKDEKELDIIIFSDAGYKTEIIGNKDLKDGSIIKVLVSDEDGNNNIYKIKIQVDSLDETLENTNDINYIPIIMTSLLVILFILDLILLIKRLKNK